MVSLRSVLALFAALVAGASALSCLDANGNAIDFWVMSKFPVLPSASGPPGQGFGFAYMDDSSSGWDASTSHDLRDTGTAIAQTLNQVYNNHGSSSVAYALYNDETPSGSESSSRGHTKGVLATDSQSGFWLIHSVPRWPPASGDGYTFPEDETDYGQSFMCISMDVATVDEIGGQFEFTYPQFYDSNVPSSLSSKLTNLNAILSGKHVLSDPYTSIKQFSSLNGATFTSFAKNREWNSNLYEDLVAPTLSSSLKTETWQNGVGRMESFCTPKYQYAVENIESIDFGNGLSYTSTKDHSKTAVAVGSGYTCIGGINRQYSQARRPGGTICFQKSNVYQAFNSIISTVESC